MANTITVQNVLDWARTRIKLLPLTSVGGISNEPALTIANNIQQFLLAPPFRWRWNRAAITSVTTAAGTQDYSPNPAVTDFGWAEKAVVISGSVSKEIDLKNALAKDAAQGFPLQVAIQTESSSNITVRFLPVPDAVYSTEIVYQKKAPLITSLSGTWAIPDDLAFLYRCGFLAEALAMADDVRAEREWEKFVRLAQAAVMGFAAEIPVFPTAEHLPAPSEVRQ